MFVRFGEKLSFISPFRFTRQQYIKHFTIICQFRGEISSHSYTITTKLSDLTYRSSIFVHRSTLLYLCILHTYFSITRWQIWLHTSHKGMLEPLSEMSCHRDHTWRNIIFPTIKSKVKTQLIGNYTENWMRENKYSGNSTHHNKM